MGLRSPSPGRLSISPVVGMGSVAPATFEGLEAEEVASAAQLKNAFQKFARGRQTSGDPGAGERGSVIANWPIDEPVLALAGVPGECLNLTQRRSQPYRRKLRIGR